jgi:hypothetical protein
MVLSSEKRIIDLLEKQSGIYSGRPHSVMMHELFVLSLLIIFLDQRPLSALTAGLTD